MLNITLQNYCRSYNSLVSRGWTKEQAENYVCNSLCEACPWHDNKGCMCKDEVTEEIEKAIKGN